MLEETERYLGELGHKVEQQKLEAKQKEERERAESKQKLADRIAKLGVAN